MAPQEEWRSVVGYEGLYEVSSLGRVRGHQKILGKRYGRGGYIRHALSKNGEKRDHYAHRLVCEAFISACPEGCEVNHLNGVRDDNRVDNLEWVTRRQNSDHKKVLGTWPSGEKNGRAKLSAALVSAIRGLLAQGNTQKHLAARFGVSGQLISEIHRGNCWVEAAA